MEKPFDSNEHFQNYKILRGLVARIGKNTSIEDITILAQFFVSSCDSSGLIDFAWGKSEDFVISCRLKDGEFVSSLTETVIKKSGVKFIAAFLDDSGSLVFVVKESLKLWNIFGEEQNAALARRR